MSRVLLLSLVFGPDTVSTATMMTQLAHGLQRTGHRVTVLTSMPHYNPSSLVLRNPAYRAKRAVVEGSEDGVRVLRVFMPLKGTRVWRRALDYAWFHLATALLGVARAGRQDVVLVTSPPITLGLVGYLLAAALGAKLVYDVRELWPDVPVRMGMIKNGLFVRLTYAIEQFVYRRAAAVTSIARSFIDSLTERGVPREKLHFTPNFVDVETIRPLPKVNSFSTEHALAEKFVVFYAGNIGLTQGLEVLVDVARALQNDDRVRLVVVGDGAGKASLEAAIDESRLPNVLMLPYQPWERVPETYATADVCISPMRRGFSYDTVPSKIYTAMAAGRPVVAASESDTEAARLLRESEAGMVVEPESAEAMAAAIRQLRDDPGLSARLGANAREWIVAQYSEKAVIAAYDRVVSAVANGSSA